MTRIEELWEGWASETLTPEAMREFTELAASGDEDATALLTELLESEAYQGLAAPDTEE